MNDQNQEEEDLKVEFSFASNRNTDYNKPSENHDDEISEKVIVKNEELGSKA